jgi:hypothetical protein
MGTLSPSSSVETEEGVQMRARPLEVARPTVSRRRKGRAPQRTAARIIEDDHNLRARTAELNAAAFAFARARGIFWTRIFVGKGQIWS